MTIDLFRAAPAGNPTKADQNTPKWLMDGVHRFWPQGIDIDYCSNRWAIALGFVRAKIVWTKDDDCLAQPPGSWAPNGADTTGWFQPDYGNPEPFARRLAQEWLRQPFACLGLVRGDWTTAAWKVLEPHMTAMGTVRCRVHHYLGMEQRDATNFASSMFYLHPGGDRASEIRACEELRRAFAPQQGQDRDKSVAWWSTLRLTGSEWT